MPRLYARTLGDAKAGICSGVVKCLLKGDNSYSVITSPYAPFKDETDKMGRMGPMGGMGLP